MERIIVQSVFKKFHIGGRKKQTALGKVLSFFCRREKQQALCALEDISFTVHREEILGIIGKNGSGKSTLLRIIAGILDKDSGTVETKGTIIPAIHLDAGVKDRLTVEENVYLIYTLFGFARKETQRKLDQIIEYSELRDFVQTKWYQLSDGMKQRVIFAAVVHAHPDILLLDEAFSVGDEQFRQKGVKTLEELAKEGAAILLAGHNFLAIERHCKRVIWIDKGKIRMEGRSGEVIRAYKNFESRK